MKEKKKKQQKNNFDYLWDLNPQASVPHCPAPFLVLTMEPLMVRNKKKI